MTSEGTKNKKLLLINVNTYFKVEIWNFARYDLMKEIYIWGEYIFIIS